jgi:type IV secretory pathway VirB4 component
MLPPETMLQSRQAPHRVTTANLGAAFPFMAQGSLGSRGVYVGQDLYGAGAFVYDPWELYPRHLTSTGMMVLGQVGKGKSGFCKTYVWRQLAFGRHAVILDPKEQGGEGEYSRLAEAAGLAPIRLEPGGRVRLNPLDTTRLGDGLSREEMAKDQIRVLYALAEAALGRSLQPIEHTACRAALAAATARTGWGQDPTLNEVVDLMVNPGEQVGDRFGLTRGELAQAGRDVALELGRLCEGDLAGMFDGPTSPDIDFMAPLVSLDMSAVYQSEALGILMVCAQARLQRQLLARQDVRRILVIEEGWAVLRRLEIARWLQASMKLARARGVQVILVTHRLSDLTSAGNAGSEQVEIAKGLLSDTETHVIFGQSTAEVEKARDLFQLNEAEAEHLPALQPHVALFRVGRRSFLVRHRLLSEDEEWIVDTDQQMRDF